MIDDFTDFCLCMQVVVDEIWQQVGPLLRRSGPPLACSDSEVWTLAIVGEYRGRDQQTESLSHFSEYRNLFPCLPFQSRFNPGRRHLTDALNLVRRAILRVLRLAADRQAVINSLPIPVIQFHLVPGSTGASSQGSDGAAFGKVPPKKQIIFGYRLRLLLRLNGVILDFELAPANASDLVVGKETLAVHENLKVVGNNGYLSESVAMALDEEHALHTRTFPNANQKVQVSNGGPSHSQCPAPNRRNDQ